MESLNYRSNPSEVLEAFLSPSDEVIEELFTPREHHYPNGEMSLVRKRADGRVIAHFRGKLSDYVDDRKVDPEADTIVQRARQALKSVSRIFTESYEDAFERERYEGTYVVPDLCPDFKGQSDHFNGLLDQYVELVQGNIPNNVFDKLKSLVEDVDSGVNGGDIRYRQLETILRHPVFIQDVRIVPVLEALAQHGGPHLSIFNYQEQKSRKLRSDFKAEQLMMVIDQLFQNDSLMKDPKAINFLESAYSLARLCGGYRELGMRLVPAVGKHVYSGEPDHLFVWSLANSLYPLVPRSEKEDEKVLAEIEQNVEALRELRKTSDDEMVKAYIDEILDGRYHYARA